MSRRRPRNSSAPMPHSTGKPSKSAEVAFHRQCIRASGLLTEVGLRWSSTTVFSPCRGPLSTWRAGAVVHPRSGLAGLHAADLRSGACHPRNSQLGPWLALPLASQLACRWRCRSRRSGFATGAAADHRQRGGASLWRRWAPGRCARRRAVGDRVPLETAIASRRTPSPGQHHRSPAGVQRALSCCQRSG